jgi:MoaA/NifB/PqqE/SkfB family radical SAM enzyme
MFLKKLKTIKWDLTSRCDLSCAACMRNEYGGPTVDGLVEQDFEHYRKLISNLDVLNVVTIEFSSTWGDPLKHDNFLDIIEELSQKHPGCILKIFTSLDHQDDEFYNRLGELLERFFRVDIFTNIYGNEESHKMFRLGASFNKVKHHTQLLSDFEKVNVTWKMLVGEWNKDHVDEVYDAAKEIEIFKFLAQRITHNVFVSESGNEQEGEFLNTQDDFEEFDDDFGNLIFKFNLTDYSKPCQALQNGYVYIDPWGYVWPCPMTGQYTFNDAVEGAFVDDAWTDHGEDFNNLGSYSLREILSHEWFNSLMSEMWKTSPWEICQKECQIGE